jgi:hypothetical protein
MAPMIAAIARHDRWGDCLNVSFGVNDGGKLHNLETSSGKILFHKSTMNDGEKSGDDKREVRVGKK